MIVTGFEVVETRAWDGIRISYGRSRLFPSIWRCWISVDGVPVEINVQEYDNELACWQDFIDRCYAQVDMERSAS